MLSNVTVVDLGPILRASDEIKRVRAGIDLRMDRRLRSAAVAAGICPDTRLDMGIRNA